MGRPAPYHLTYGSVNACSSAYADDELELIYGQGPGIHAELLSKQQEDGTYLLSRLRDRNSD